MLTLSSSAFDPFETLMPVLSDGHVPRPKADANKDPAEPGRNRPTWDKIFDTHTGGTSAPGDKVGIQP